MAERAAHLIDHVFPRVPVRQWVLSLPHRLRYRLAWDHALCRAVVGRTMRAILGFLRRQAREAGIADGRSGAVTIVQRFGGALNTNIHFHVFVLDGVFEKDDDDVRFHPSPSLEAADVDEVLATVEAYVQRLLAWRSSDDGGNSLDEWADEAPVLAGLAAASVQGRVALGARAGARVRRRGQTPAAVTYWYRDHRTQSIQHETLPVLRFIGRMVQHILPKGFQRIRYYGLHSHRQYDTVRQQLAVRPRADGRPDPRGYRVVPRKPFAQRFAETFGTDPLRCPTCGDTMDLAVIYHPAHGILYDVLASGWEAPHEPTARASPERLRRPVDRARHVVQLPLPDV